MQENGLTGKARLISKFITSQTGKQTITIYILSSISRRKGNQAIKFVLLVEYYMKIIFFEKSYKNIVDKLVQGLYIKNQN